MVNLGGWWLRRRIRPDRPVRRAGEVPLPACVKSEGEEAKETGRKTRRYMRKKPSDEPFERSTVSHWTGSVLLS